MSQTRLFPALLLKGAILLSLVAVFPGCKSDRPGVYSPPEFQETVEEEFEVISDEIYGVKAISDMVVYGSKVIVCALNHEDGTILHIYDKESGEPLMHTLNYGRGPKELLFDANISFLQESGTMVFFDIIASKRLDIDVDGLMEHGLDAVEEVYWPSRLWNLRNIALENGSLHTYNISYLQRDTSSVERIELCDRNGNIISTYNEFPVIDDDRKRFMMYNNELIAVSPDEEKVVITTSVGGILEIFSMKDGELKNIATKYFIEPGFSIEGDFCNYDDLIYSFSDLCATDDAIYAAYGGESDFKSHTGCRNIAIFDWNGNPLKLIRTGHRIERLCLDSEDNALYAMIQDSEGRPYIGRVRL